MHDPFSAVRHFDPRAGHLETAAPALRRLKDLPGVFGDAKAFAAACAAGNPLVYTVASAEPAYGAGGEVLILAVTFGNWQQDYITRYEDDFGRA